MKISHENILFQIKNKLLPISDLLTRIEYEKILLKDENIVPDGKLVEPKQRFVESYLRNGPNLIPKRISNAALV